MKSRKYGINFCNFYFFAFLSGLRDSDNIAIKAKQSGNETLDEDEAALYILKELWNRLRETHRLRAVK